MKKMIKLTALFLSVICLLSVFSGLGLAAKADAPGAQTQANGKNDKLIALTFDDGPGRNTAKLLDGLRKRGVHCTFFVVGQYAKSYPATIRQCYEDGHQIASHSYTHAWLTNLSDSEIRSEMQRTSDTVAADIGCKLTLMVRPPYGAYNDRVLSVLGVPAFYWSDDSGDWKSGATADSVYQNTIRTAGDGDILLLHDSHSWSCEAAIRIVDTLLAQGYEFVTLSELFRRRGVPLQAGHIYSYLRANGTNLPAIFKPKVTMTPTETGMQITLTADPGTTIRYTTDGTVPTAASKVYTKPFILTQAVTLNAVAGYDMNGSRSNRLTVSVPKLRACRTPQITIDNGTVTITAPDTVYYTTDGSDPTSSSAKYTGSFTVTPDTVVKAMAYSGDANTVRSAIAVLYYSERGNLFDDVFPQQWFADAVDLAYSEGRMVGTAEHHFAPNAAVTRAQLVTVLANQYGGVSEGKTSVFSDVPAGKWFTDAVIWAEENYIVAGYPDGLFHPNDPLTREQAAVILSKYALLCGLDTRYSEDLSRFTDGTKVAEYAVPAMRWAVEHGFLAGNEAAQLLPKAVMSRAQLACVLNTYLDRNSNRDNKYLTDEELLALSDQLISYLKEKDFASLLPYIHPEKGLTYTPYSTVGEDDCTILKYDSFRAQGTDETCLWGFYDGSGEPIELTFEDYWDRFVWNTDYTEADTVTANQITLSGNAIENVAAAYKDCLFTEYAVKSLYGYEDGTDWSALKLVFCYYNGQWYLTGLIHGEWTV